MTSETGAPVANSTDSTLLDLARAGDRRAQQTLVNNHQNDVFYLALGLIGQRSDAEDVMQEVMIKALKGLKKFRGESGFATWLYRITHNACLDWRRRQRWRQTTDSIDDNPALLESWQNEQPADHPERVSDNHELGKDLLSALEKLTPAERGVFVMRHFQQLSTRETADLLGKAEGSVKNLLFRAVHKLRQHLASHAPGAQTL
nr:RNA polymerase sigma factor YlaC-like [Nerophis lumbriciformis]